MASSLELAPGTTEFDHVLVRNLRAEDLDAVVRIERNSIGQARHEYYQVKIQTALEDTGIKISLIAEVQGIVAGFLLGQVYYGEFGLPEPTAIIDSIGVDPDYRGQHVAGALLRQLRTNLKALNIETIQTQVNWQQRELLGFFAREGFAPAPRLCLQQKIN